MDINTRMNDLYTALMNDLYQALAMQGQSAEMAAPAGQSHDATPPIDATPPPDPTITTTTQDSPPDDAGGASRSPMPNAGSDEEARRAGPSEGAIWG